MPGRRGQRERRSEAAGAQEQAERRGRGLLGRRDCGLGCDRNREIVMAANSQECGGVRVDCRFPLRHVCSIYGGLHCDD